MLLNIFVDNVASLLVTIASLLNKSISSSSIKDYVVFSSLFVPMCFVSCALVQFSLDYDLVGLLGY